MNKMFELEFYRMWNQILSHTPMAYARYADGEVSLMKGYKVNHASQAFQIDQWDSMGDKISLLGMDLKETLHHIDPEYYYAISCKCCDPIGMNWLLSEIKQPDKNITYSNLWINGNYKRFIEEVGKLSDPIYLVCNKQGLEGLYPFDVCGVYPVENNCVSEWAKNKFTMISDIRTIAKSFNHTRYFISAGPLSEVFIHHMWESNPTNQYIDVGSAIDEFVHLRKTRQFMMTDSPYFKQECHF